MGVSARYKHFLFCAVLCDLLAAVLAKQSSDQSVLFCQNYKNQLRTKKFSDKSDKKIV